MFSKVGTEHHGSISTFPCATWCRNRFRSRTRPCGWRVRSCRPSNVPASTVLAALGFQFVSADAAHAWVHAYYNAITKRLKKLADYDINPNMALCRVFMCAKTDEEARARADGATFFQFACATTAGSNRARPAPGTVTCGTNTQVEARKSEAQEAALRGGLIGSPKPSLRTAAVRNSHIDQVILLKPGWQEQPRAYLRFARSCSPRSDAGIPERSGMTTGKKGVMSGAIQLEGSTPSLQDRYGKLAVNVRRRRRSRGIAGFVEQMEGPAFDAGPLVCADPAGASWIPLPPGKLRSTALPTSSVLERMPYRVARSEAS